MTDDLTLRKSVVLSFSAVCDVWSKSSNSSRIFFTIFGMSHNYAYSNIPATGISYDHFQYVHQFILRTLENRAKIPRQGSRSTGLFICVSQLHLMENPTATVPWCSSSGSWCLVSRFHPDWASRNSSFRWFFECCYSLRDYRNTRVIFVGIVAIVLLLGAFSSVPGS